MPLEKLNLALVLFRRRACPKRSEVSAPAGLGIHLSGIQAVFAGL
jgi:hypothetical protein